jgi:flagellar motor switch protein FliN
MVNQLAEVEVKAALEFGGADMRLRELLVLESGSTIMMDRDVETPVDLVVGGHVVAHGEVVIIGGQFVLRVLDRAPETAEQSETIQ